MRTKNKRIQRTNQRRNLFILICIVLILLSFHFNSYWKGLLFFVLGLSLKPHIENLIAGVILMFEGSVRKKDLLLLDSGELGFVKSLHWNFIRISTRNRTEYFIENAKIARKKIINLTFLERSRRFHIPFRVEKLSNTATMREFLLPKIEDFPLTLAEKPKPELWLLKAHANFLDLKLVVWSKPNKDISSVPVRPLYLEQIKSIIEEKGLKILPERQFEIHLEKVD